MLEQPQQSTEYVAFLGTTLLGRGSLKSLALQAKELMDRGETRRIAIFDDQTGKPIDIDFRGDKEQVILSLSCHPLLSKQQPSPDVPASKPDGSKPGRGRPKLGVVSREVSLLPRHWQWLSTQRGGASASLRRLVDEARKTYSQQDISRHAVEATHRFMWDMAGDQVGFEDASRALFKQNFSSFEKQTQSWPTDVRAQILKLLSPARMGLIDESGSNKG